MDEGMRVRPPPQTNSDKNRGRQKLRASRELGLRPTSDAGSTKDPFTPGWQLTVLPSAIAVNAERRRHAQPECRRQGDKQAKEKHLYPRDTQHFAAMSADGKRNDGWAQPKPENSCRKPTQHKANNHEPNFFTMSTRLRDL